jgi:signal transduction histidine kinase
MAVPPQVATAHSPMFPQSDGNDRAQRARALTGAGFVLLLWLAAVAFDVLTGPELTGLFLYLVAVIFAVWRMGAWAGIIASMASTAAAIAVAHNWGRGLPGAMQSDWNTLTLLAVFMLCVWLSDRMRTALNRERRTGTASGMTPTPETGSGAILQGELSIRETEQRRIGRDLHDGLSQHLTATMLVARLLEEKLAARSIGEADEAGQVTRLIEDAIGQVQHLSRGLYPVELAGMGLAGALEQLAANTQRLSGIPCAWVCGAGGEPADEAVATHLYRIAQEAVGNALRHASPRSVTIRLEARGGTIALDVIDDGIGLSPSAMRSGGLGMRTMRERARAIGGVLEVVPLSPRGTRVTCAVPGAAWQRVIDGPHPEIRPAPGGNGRSETAA